MACNSAFIPVIDREIVIDNSQSVLPTHHASIFPAKSTRVVKMVARIEAGASFSKWEKWNKMFENFKSSHQVESSVLCSKNVASANRRLSPKLGIMITNTLMLSMAAFIRASRGVAVQDCAPINSN